MILKSSEKYLIIKKNNSVYKISKSRNKTNIIKEYRLLKKLHRDSRYKNILPKIYELAKIKTGLLKGNYYYRQSLLSGNTFSNEIKKLNYYNSIELYTKVSKKLISICKNSNFSVVSNKNDFIKKIFKDELKNFKNYNDLSNISSSKIININNKKYNNLIYYLDKIFSSEIFKKSIKNFRIVRNEHWNFHGDNLIINKKNFKIIDPDTSIIHNDMYFSYSRFLYSFLHDTCFYKKYFIKTNDLIFKSDIPKFHLFTTWSKNAKKNYSLLFTFINSKTLSKNNFFKKFQLDTHDIFRIKIMYLFCLLRGINRNYQKIYKYVDSDNSKVQIDHLYLYLQSVIFAKDLMDIINDRK